MVPNANDDHDCEWKSAFERLEAKLEAIESRTSQLEDENSALKQRLATQGKKAYGRSSEKRVRSTKAKKTPTAEEKAQSLEKRRQNRQAIKELPSKEILHKVEDSERVCKDCGKERRAIGSGRATEVIERVSASLIREIHLQETLSCGCGATPVQAKAPSKPIFGGRYGAGLLAHLVASKCADSIPIHRLVKKVRREGIHISKSTLNSLFHKVSDQLAPLVSGMRTLIMSRDLIASDDTGIKVLNRDDKI